MHRVDVNQLLLAVPYIGAPNKIFAHSPLLQSLDASVRIEASAGVTGLMLIMSPDGGKRGLAEID